MGVVKAKVMKAGDLGNLISNLKCLYNDLVDGKFIECWEHIKEIAREMELTLTGGVSFATAATAGSSVATKLSDHIKCLEQNGCCDSPSKVAMADATDMNWASLIVTIMQIIQMLLSKKSPA